MRHRRGIDLTGGNNDNMPPKPTGIFGPQRDHSATLADLPQWYVVGRNAGAASASACWIGGRYSGAMGNSGQLSPWSRCYGALAAAIARKTVLFWREQIGIGHDLRTQARHLRLFVGRVLQRDGLLHAMQPRRESRSREDAARAKLY